MFFFQILDVCEAFEHRERDYYPPQVTFIFSFLKVSLIQTTEQEALPPPELQLRIADILTASPDIAETVSLLCSSINLLKKQ